MSSEFSDVPVEMFLQEKPLAEHEKDCRIAAIKDKLGAKCICSPVEKTEFQIVLGYPGGKMIQAIPGTTFSSAKDAEATGLPLLWADPDATEMFVCRVEAAFRKAISKTL